MQEAGALCTQRSWTVYLHTEKRINSKFNLKNLTNKKIIRVLFKKMKLCSFFKTHWHMTLKYYFKCFSGLVKAFWNVFDQVLWCDGAF